MHTRSYLSLFATTALTLTLTACGHLPDGSPSETHASSAPVTFNIITNDRSDIGSITLSESAGEVIAHIQVSGISPGLHGVHFHAVADCSDDKFLNTTGHINPHGKQHGLNNSEGPDNADLPNLVADENGNVNQIVRTPRVTLSHHSDTVPALLDADGSALVIHANRDDQVSQPIGGAGGRIGCAEIR